MTHRERILAVIKGQPVDRIPFIPRLDIWYNANKRNGTLPGKYKNASLKEISEDLGLGYHAVVPDFRDYGDEEGDLDLGLGIHRFRALPYKLTFHNIKQNISRTSDGLLRSEYITPKGTIKTCIKYDEEMRKAGSTLPVTLEHAVKGIEDFEALAYIFENVEVEPNYGYFARFREDVVGENGVAVATCSLWASPMYYLLKELMSVENFFFALFDYPEEMEWLSDKLMPFARKIFDVTADSPAELILSGANYDNSITTPQFFGKYIAPELKRQSEILHEKGKYLVTHTDGENTGLLEHFVASEFDVADSICPYPLTRLTLAEVRKVFDGKITIWGGIPSTSVLENSMSDYEFEKYLDDMLQSIGKGDHLIFSIADTTPPGAKLERILKIEKKVKEFGSVL